MEIVSSLVGKIVEYTIESIGRQLKYVCLMRQNIQNLESEVERLKNTKESVQDKVSEAKRNADNIKPSVETWLTKVDAIIEQSEAIMLNNEAQQLGLCFNFVQRHQLSRKALKLADEVLQLNKEGKFDSVSYMTALSEVESSRAKTADFLDFESRKSTIKQIISVLMDENVNRIGVYGMGGVGKTILVKEISRIVKEKKVFDEVVISTISQTPDLKRIQGQLADKLGLKFNEETEEGRALRLEKRLKMDKSILIVLDDVWKDIELETIGIPSTEDHFGCKILFTSRDRGVLDNMCTDKIFKIEVLQRDETWKLFKTMAGEIVESSDFKSIAVEIAKECAHLPIAITTIAKALRKKPLSIWQDALDQLRNPVVVNIKGMNKEVYSPLKLSYEQLDCEEAKLLFLFCSMFPEDYPINVTEVLHVYAMGMGFLSGVDFMAQARRRVTKLVDDLLSSSLLLKEPENKGGSTYVKMHDIIRDVAILISFKDDRVRTLSYSKGLDESWPEKKILGDHTVVYLDVEGLCNPPQKLMLPKVQSLTLCGPFFDGRALPITFFEEMEELKVLYLMKIKISFQTLLLYSFANLHSLCFIDCVLENIEMIGELKKLEILSLQASNIIQIPMAMSQLTQLKVLDLSRCYSLKVIPPNILLSLTKLEELYLETFSGWEGEEFNEGRRNASLSELSYLSHLYVLELWIPDEIIMPKQLFSTRLDLEKFNIFVGGRPYRTSTKTKISRSLLHLKMEREGCINNGIKMLLKRSEELQLVGSIGARLFQFELNDIDFSDLKYLYIRDPSKIQHLIHDNDDSFFNQQVSFPKLEELEFEAAHNLKIICRNILCPNSFCKLKILKIFSCHSLEKIFPSNIVSRLTCLKSLHIGMCELLEGVFEVQEPNHTKKDIDFLPNLRELTLNELPSLQYIWEKNSCELLNLKNIKTLSIYQCPKLKLEFPVKVIQQVEKLEVDFSGLKEILRKENSMPMPGLDEIATSKDGPKLFSKLKSLKLYGYHDHCQTDLPMEVVQVLQNLEEFQVSQTLFEEVFPIERLVVNVEEQQNDGFKISNFRLYDLPKLKHLWSGDLLMPSSMSFRNLFTLSVVKCPKLNSLLNPLVARTLVQLRMLIIRECKRMTTIIYRRVEEDDEVLFNKLFHLEICDLPNLTSFHSGKCTIKFPNLKRISIKNCPEMRNFSLGMISTPCLPTKNIGYRGNDWVWFSILKDSKEIIVEDINVIIQQVWEDNYDTDIKFLFKEQDLEEKQCDLSSHVEELELE